MIRTCKLLASAATLALGVGASIGHAEVFYSGQTKGQRGDMVELIVNARAGTTLEAIDIVPDIAGVTGILNLNSFQATAELKSGGSGLCEDGTEACALFFLEAKTFAADTPLARMRFKIDNAAPIGVVNFDPGVTVGEDILPLPDASRFQVLAIPEPGTWAMVVVGLGIVAVGARRR